VAEEEGRQGWRGIESVVAEIRELGRRATAVRCDLTQEAQIRDLVAGTVAELGRLDILVNASRAFMRRERATVLELTEEEWDWVMAVNVRGPLTASRYAALAMIEGGNGGAIVNISSMAGKKAMPVGAAYSSSKAALNMLTMSMALELAPHGIRVNAVCPGVVATSRVSQAEKVEAEAEGIAYEAYRKRWLEERGPTIPIGRAASPEEVADVAYFLASDQSRYMIGQCLNVDGGLVM
jgi:3-oxoacyl-[acyl-carrier protein] reductase/meso-butanediol dehydrogenase/(S,S)-butanediol dehydrogenase/diacetyl reductase